MKQSLVMICYLVGLCTMAQSQEVYNAYVTSNYNRIGDKIRNQQNLPNVFRNLKGKVKSVIQDSYDQDGVYLSYKSDPDASYKYILDENNKVLQHWYYSDRDQPVIKEIFYDFKNQRPQYQMKFYAPGLMEYSITYLYNNRGICLGTKTTAGMSFTKDTYQILTSSDTTFIASNDGVKSYLSGRVISDLLDESQQLEAYSYFEDGAIQEWSVKEFGYLREVMEFDSEGALIERQYFNPGKDSLVIESHLVIYHYNSDGLLDIEDHRLSADNGSNYKVTYAYDTNNQVIEKVLTSDNKERSFTYSYNDHGDCTNDASGYKSNSLVSIEYGDYDHNGNWLKKMVTTQAGAFRYMRRIEYFD